MAYDLKKPHLVWYRNGDLCIYTDHRIKLENVLFNNQIISMAKAKLVWYKDGKLQTYTNKWEVIGEGPTPEPVAVTGVSLNKNSLTLGIDESEKLTATVTPSNATNKRVSWSSSNSEVASVSSNGTVRGVSVGSATITVTTQDGSFTDTCSVTVSNGQHEVQEVGFANYLPENPVYLTANRSDGFPIKVTPYTASNIEVEVISGDSSVVEVGQVYYDQEPTEWSVGGVTLFGVNPGNTTVTIRSVENPDAYATYNIIVEQDIPVQSISNLSSATGDAYKYEAGGDTRGIATFDYSPSNAVRPQEDISMSLKEGETSIGYGWIQQSDEPGVAQINFQVDPNAQVGDSAVYEIMCDEPEPTRGAKKSRSVPLEIEITVGAGVTELENLNTDTLELELGQTNTSKTFTYYPSNAEFDSIIVESNNPNWFSARAVKDSDGVGHIEVIALQPGSGSVNIRCGYGYSSGFSVYIPEPQTTDVETLSNQTTSLFMGEVGQRDAVAYTTGPAGANRCVVDRAISDPTVIQVYDESFSEAQQEYTATFEFIGVGSAVIKPYINGVQQGENPISVTVSQPQPQASITIDTSNVNVEEGQTTNRFFTYTPTDADFNDIVLNNQFPGVATTTLVKDGDGFGHVEIIGVASGGSSIELVYAGNTYSFYVAVSAPVIPVTAVSNFSSTTLSLTVGQTSGPTFEVTPANANDSSTISLSFGTPGIAQLSSISLNPGYSAFMYIEGLSVGTTTADVLVDGVSTGITLNITVTPSYTLTFIPRDGTTDQEGGGTLSEQSYVVTQDGCTIWSNTSYDFDLHISTNPSDYAGSIIKTIIATPDSGKSLSYLKYYDEGTSTWEDISEYGGTIINGDMQIRAYFS